MNNLQKNDQSKTPITPGQRYIDNRGYYSEVIRIEDGKVFYKSPYGGTSSSKESEFRDRMVLDDMTDAEFFAALQDPSSLMPDDAKGHASGTALATTSAGISSLRQMEIVAAEAKHKAELVKRRVEALKDRVQSVVSKMSDRLKYANGILRALDLYAGTYEEIKTLRDGVPAPADMPITVVQLVRYMDEEIDYLAQAVDPVHGINCQSVEEFDAWISRPEVMKDQFPFPKCIVGYKPSQQIVDTGDPFLDQIISQGNQAVYLIIRNGDKLSRVFANVSNQNQLFIDSDSWQSIDQQLSDALENDGSESTILKTKGAKFAALSDVLLLQGLVDRTSVLSPTDEGLNFFEQEWVERGRVFWLRDAEGNSLTDSTDTPPFREWKKSEFAKVKRGDRIILSHIPWERGDGRCHSQSYRFDGNYYHSVPELPNGGIYTVEEVSEKRYLMGRAFRIMYLPERNVDWSIATRRVSIWVCGSDPILPYDNLTVTLLETFARRRMERRNYRNILPLVYRSLMELREELAHEQVFVTELAGRIGVDRAIVEDAVVWWKTKVIKKRPISKDDAKAWRMIEKRSKRKA